MLEEAKIALKRLLLQIWTLKLILVRAQIKLRNMLVDTGRKRDLSYKSTKDMAELSSSVLWKVAFVSDELGYLTKETSKQSCRV